jgi:hypothetical protein
MRRLNQNHSSLHLLPKHVKATTFTNICVALVQYGLQIKRKLYFENVREQDAQKIFGPKRQKE